MSNMRLISSAKAAPAALTKAQADALDAYNNAVAQFKSVLNERRAQIEANQPLPNLAGTGALSRAHRHDERVQRPHRPVAGKNRPAQQIRHSARTISTPTTSRCSTSTRISSPSCRRRPRMRKTPARRFTTSSTWPPRSRAPRASMRRMPRSQAASASAFSLPRPTATRTSAMRVPTNTRAAFRPAYRRIGSAERNGRRCEKRSPLSIRH